VASGTKRTGRVGGSGRRRSWTRGKKFLSRPRKTIGVGGQKEQGGKERPQVHLRGSGRRGGRHQAVEACVTQWVGPPRRTAKKGHKRKKKRKRDLPFSRGRSQRKGDGACNPRRNRKVGKQKHAGDPTRWAWWGDKRQKHPKKIQVPSTVDRVVLQAGKVPRYEVSWNQKALKKRESHV